MNFIMIIYATVYSTFLDLRSVIRVFRAVKLLEKHSSNRVVTANRAGEIFLQITPSFCS